MDTNGEYLDNTWITIWIPGEYLENTWILYLDHEILELSLIEIPEKSPSLVPHLHLRHRIPGGRGRGRRGRRHGGRRGLLRHARGGQRLLETLGETIGKP